MTATFVILLDFIGTFVFAISGALVAVRHRLDLFGVLVLSFAAATAGGITRDVLLGATPPASLVDWRYFAVASLAGLLTFYRHAQVERMRNPVQLFDAVGLGLFAVLGANKALAFGVGPVGAVMLGMLSGIGGGIARDVLVAQVPNVLRRELYAVAALAGALVVVAGHALRWPAAPVAVAGASLCFGLRWNHGDGSPDTGTLPASPTPCLDAPSTPMTDHLHLRAQRLLPAFLATGMSAFVAAVVTAVNTGIDGGFMLRWAYAWTLALPSAIVAAYLFRPLAWRAAVALARSRLLSPRTPGTR